MVVLRIGWYVRLRVIDQSWRHTAFREPSPRLTTKGFSMSNRTGAGVPCVLVVLAAVLGSCLAAEIPQPERTVLWQIGARDNSTAEFALAPSDYQSYHQAGCFVVGRSDPKKDWPYVQPGPADSGWAPGQPQTFIVLFGLNAAPAEPCRLVLDLVDTHWFVPPRLRVEINDLAQEFQTSAGGDDGQSVFGDPSQGRECVLTVDVPPKSLKAGNNVIAITTTSGSWMLWDALRFETPRGTSLSEASSAIAAVDVHPTLVRSGELLLQPATAKIVHLGPASAASLHVDGSAPQRVSLEPGCQVVQMLLSAVTSPATATLQLRSGDQVVDERPLHRQPVRKWEIHLIHQTHLDIGFTHTQQEVLKLQVGFLHKALDLIKETAAYPADSRFKWHPEGMWAIDEFLRTATEEKREEFLVAVRSGAIHLDGFYVHVMTGLATDEELLQLMQPAKDFEKQYGVKVTTAIGSDVPGYTWGLVSAMSQQGVKYLNTAPNNNHRLGYIYLLSNGPFYWVDPSGQRRVLCWMVPNSYIHFWDGGDKDVGSAVLDFIDHYLVAKNYPYDVAQLRYEIGGDNGYPDPNLARQVKDWNEKYAYPRIILSTNTRMFSEFEERYGKDLPVLSGDMTPYWEDGAASTSADLAINRHAKEELAQAERLWALLNPRLQLHDLFRQAWRNVIMYDEHTWGAHSSISEPFSEFTVSQEKFKQKFAHSARDVARQILGQVTAPIIVKDSQTIDLYNTASWDRGGVVLLPRAVSAGGDRLVSAAGKEVPTQRLGSGELVVLSPTIPALGAARFTLHSGMALASGDVKVEGHVLENGRIRIEIDPQNGSIKSLFSKSLNRELVELKEGFGLNDYLYTLGRVTGEGYSRITTPVTIAVEDPGPVVGTIKIESAAPGCTKLIRRVRIYDAMDRVDLINQMQKQQQLQPESVYFAFPLNVPEGQPRINVPLAVVRPEKDQLPGANRNYYCVERWVDVSNADYGVTWITCDAPMIKFHPFKIIGRGRGCLPAASMMYDKTPDGVPEFWDREIKPTPFFYSWVMTNHWETNYRAYQEGPHQFAYTLVPHGQYDQAVAQREARDVTQPLLALPADPARPIGPPAFCVQGDGVVVTSLRPSRDGRALMVRLFAASGKPERPALQCAEPQSVYLSDPQESRGPQIEGPIDLPAYGVVTLRLERQ